MYTQLSVLLLFCIGLITASISNSSAQSVNEPSEKHRILYWLTLGLGGASEPEVEGMVGGTMLRGVFALDNSSISAKVEGYSNTAPLSFDFNRTETSVCMYSVLFGRQLWRPLNNGAWILRGAIGPAFITHTTTHYFFWNPPETSQKSEPGLALELEGLIEPAILGAGLSMQLYATRHSFMGTFTVNISFGKFD